MQTNEALRALRGDVPAQHRAQKAMEKVVADWRSSGLGGAARDELKRFGEGAEWKDCPTLVQLIGDHAMATALVTPLIEGIAAALRDHPFGHVPFRHQLSDGVAMLQLIQAGPAVVTLLAYGEEAAVPAPETVSFSDVERHEIVLSGAADLRIAELIQETGTHAAIDCSPRRVVEGEPMHFPPDVARIAEKIHGQMVVLRVARSPLQPRPSRAFRLDDGSLVHRASGDRGESRREIAMAVLGRMGRHDAAPLLAELAREGSDHFRWQALRECIALDSATGFAALTECANATDDALAGHAGALRAHLVEAYPQLAGLKESVPCPV
ncbi:HEAT repeat domain-containing protein [Qipengyuania soli]|uniref:HEAT repeat domain-containing protein n=1 Tax=Qipengyuania soli TaxID=2782568 RepID=A0A7S8F5L8_9SPHN|nr:HEAT repeat domain-containing protein [Qipengyuania soli]QPC99581.1 HEAT repeat domain-containing protein [Qipengyuania soli]